MENHIYMVLFSDFFFSGMNFAIVWWFSDSQQSFVEGFKLGSEKHSVEATVQKSGALNLTSGIVGLALLKTTQVYNIYVL